MKQRKSIGQVTLDIKKSERKKDYEDKLGTWRQELNAQTFIQQAESCLQILKSLIDSLQQPNRWKYSFQLLALSRNALEDSKLIWAAMDAIYIISSRLGTIEDESVTIRNSLERVEQDVIDFVRSTINRSF